MSFFVFDIETLGVESTSVILSAGIVYVEPEALMPDVNQAFKQLTDSSFSQNSLFVKFKSVEQTKPPYNRVVDKGTLDWWNKKGAMAKDISFVPKASDVSVPDGIKMIQEFMKRKSSEELIIWTRGSLDQMAIDSLCTAYGISPIAKYNAYRDIRTAVDIIYTNGKNGYVEIPGFDESLMIEHDPVHDCARDALMLIRGKQD